MTFTEGSQADRDQFSGTYGPVVNGVTVATGSIQQNRFEFQFPLPANVSDGMQLTAVSTGPVSEFSHLILAGELGSAVPPEITLQLASDPILINEGETLSVDGSFYDPDSRSWTATVDYGDGSSVQPLLLRESRDFQLSHLYSTPGTWNVTVKIVDNGFAVGSKTFQVSVANQLPQVNFSSFSLTQTVIEGGTASLSGSFTDGGGAHVVEVFWGDGGTSTIQLPSGTFTFSASHTYQDDSNSAGAITTADIYPVTVTVRDATSSSGTTSPDGLLLVEVVNQSPTLGQLQFNGTTAAPGSTLTVLEGAPLVIDGSFLDSGLPDVHTVRLIWGDGTSTQLTLSPGLRSFNNLPEFSHVYKNDSADGPILLTLELLDDDQPAQPVQVTWNVQISDVAPSGVVVNPVPASVGEMQLVRITGNFTDPGTADAHEVRVIWGDGTPDSVLNLDPGVRSFNSAALEHRYENNQPGNTAWPVQVVITDRKLSSAFASGTTSVTVNNLAPEIGTLTVKREDGTSGPISEGDLVIVTGSFTDPSPLDRHEVTIAWGDGRTTKAAVNALDRSFTASYRYRDNFAAAQITATVTDGRFSSTVFQPDGGSDTSDPVLQTVTNVAPSAQIAPTAWFNTNRY